MIIEPVVIFAVIALIFFLLLFLFTLTVSYRDTIKKLYQKEQSRVASIAHEQHTQYVLDQAKNQADNIVKQANRQANMILSTVESIDEKSKKAIAEKLDQIVLEQQQAFEHTISELANIEKQAIEKAAQNDIKTITTIAQDLTAEAAKEIQAFRNILAQETLAAQKIISQKIDLQNTDLEKELEEYKKQQQARLDKALIKVIGFIAKETLGKTIPLSEHQEILLSSLEKAKREGVLS